MEVMMQTVSWTLLKNRTLFWVLFVGQMSAGSGLGPTAVGVHYMIGLEREQQ